MTCENATVTPIHPGARARYAVPVADGQVDRAAWARIVEELIAAQTRGKIAPFARKVGVDPRTVSRWLAAEVNVSEESIREVARKTDQSPIQLLVEVGYYSHAETTPASQADERDEEVELILRAPVDQRTKELALEQLHIMRMRDQQRRMEDLEFLLRQQRDVG